MKRRRVDWKAVRSVRERLDQLAGARPHLVDESNNIKAWEDILKKQEEKPKTEQTAFRLPVELVERLDQHMRRLRDASPGLAVTRADVVRMLLTAGLDKAEEQLRRRRK